MKPRHALFAIAAAAIAFNASAQQKMKPGLWEITHNMSSSSGEMEKARAQMQQQMASMPPEQRKQMEKMMAERGMKPGAGGMGGNSMQMCMTKEMVERSEMPSQKGDCKTTRNERSGNTLKVAYTCTTPPSSGEGEYTFTSPEAYTMKMVMKTTMHGKPETMTMTGSGKWLSADCGSVKPLQPPPAKK